MFESSALLTIQFLKAISSDRGSNAASKAQVSERRINQALARCLADLEARGEVSAPYDRAGEVLDTLVPALVTGNPDAARASVLDSDLPTRELLDLILRARHSVRRGRERPQRRMEQERAADAALRTLADKEDPVKPEDLERRRQIATVHRRLMSLLTDGVMTARPNGNLVHANAAARDILGLRLRDLKNTSIVSLFKQKRVGERVWEELSREGVVRAREVDLQSHSGRGIPVRIASARADGPDPRILFVFRDLTEIRHIRSRLLETEKLDAMAKIAGSVAHEIRNPLNALFLNADLLEDELAENGEASESIQEILRVMREEIERLNRVIKNYLSLSKLSNANFEVLDLNQVVAEFAEEAEEAAAQGNVKLEMRLSRGVTNVRADRNMIRRVLVNLVQNAIDATPEGGRIIIGTRRLLHKAKLWVRDSGPGISRDVRPQLFQPFFSTKERGTGLGLYLILEIVMAHDGEVALRSVHPKGAQATVLLPRLTKRGGTRGES